METWCFLVCYLSSAALAGKDTDEELAHYIKKEPSTDMPWTSNEMRINKMIEEEIIKFNYAPETTENPIDSEGRPRTPEPKDPLWWNAYRQEKDGDRPDWSAEIRDLLKNPRTAPPWTPSQESQPVLSKWVDISPFTWKPGVKISWTRRKTTTPDPNAEPTTERSIVLSSAHWDTEEQGGGGGKEPPLNLAPLRKGYKEDNHYLLVKSRKRHSKITEEKQSPIKKILKGSSTGDENKQLKQKEVKLRHKRKRRSRKMTMNHNFVHL
ncbi:uncharacterized protein LOC129005043 [Macrosteles quadrilineatus]|uniref:uncharacterized protein LOC129005043 n=1 Tax=Macrosteles quadrilineatus TaxID=74068 RepID=UPI0023E1B434|nr:uncharacterized protein LOC129005043 [Macrosteles quadrilineatus]